MFVMKLCLTCKSSKTHASATKKIISVIIKTHVSAHEKYFWVLFRDKKVFFYSFLQKNIMTLDEFNISQKLKLYADYYGINE